MLSWLRERGSGGKAFDFVVEGETQPDDHDNALAKVGPLKQAGATWWLETRWTDPAPGEVRQRIEAGPPIIS
jgi:hypothetical protein